MPGWLSEKKFEESMGHKLLYWDKLQTLLIEVEAITFIDLRLRRI